MKYYQIVLFLFSSDISETISNKYKNKIKLSKNKAVREEGQERLWSFGWMNKKVTLNTPWNGPSFKHQNLEDPFHRHKVFLSFFHNYRVYGKSFVFTVLVISLNCYGHIKWKKIHIILGEIFSILRFCIASKWKRRKNIAGNGKLKIQLMLAKL